MSWGGRGRRCKLWEGRAHCREVDMVTLSREAKGLEPSRSDPSADGSVRAPLLSLAQGSRSRVIRRNSLLGKGGGACWRLVCANPGPEVFRGTGELQGGEGRAVRQTSSLASTPTPSPPRGGGRAAQGARWWRRQRKGCHCPFFLLVLASPRTDDSPAVTSLTGANEIRVTELMRSDWTLIDTPLLQGSLQAGTAPWGRAPPSHLPAQLSCQTVLGSKLLRGLTR